MLSMLALADCGSGSAPSPSSGDMATSFPASKCATASDCRLYSSYCKSRPCECLPLARMAVDPPCLVGNQACLVDPCTNKTADCQAGACVVR
jgi:hypothetical protein